MEQGLRRGSSSSSSSSRYSENNENSDGVDPDSYRDDNHNNDSNSPSPVLSSRRYSNDSDYNYDLEANNRMDPLVLDRQRRRRISDPFADSDEDEEILPDRYNIA